MFRLMQRPRAGFTLVEMLVVIVIIGILAALITAAAATALWSAKQTKIKLEVDQLAGAMEAFKQKYGAYPPANLNCPAGTGGVYYANAQLTAFVGRAFPRYAAVGGSSQQGTIPAQIAYDLNNAGVDIYSNAGNNEFNPQESLVFWLSGFGPDPTDPFNRNNIGVTRTPFFSFDQSRLVLADAVSTGNVGSPAAVSTTGTLYLNTGGTLSPWAGNSTPTYGLGQIVYNAPYGNAAYCYFDYQSYGTLTVLSSTIVALAPTSASANPGIVYATPSSPPTSEYLNPTASSPIPTPVSISTGTGYVMPYVFDVNSNGIFDPGDTFCKPTSFQIISAGQDGSFGTTLVPGNGRLYPTGYGYDPPPTVGGSADDDNVTNFCEKSNLDAAKP